MGMKLRRGVSIDRPGRVMLELRSDELPRCLCRVIAADAGLRIALQLVQPTLTASRFTVRLTHAVIAADKRRERYGLWSGKRGIPSGPVLYRCDGLSVRGLVLMLLPVLDKLLAGLRVLAFTQARKFLRANRSREAESPGQPAMPLALNAVALRPIVLFGNRELFFMVGLRLRC